MLTCFFGLIYNLLERNYCRRAIRWRGRGERGRGGRGRGEKRWPETPNGVALQEVLCALSWHLRLHSWIKIHIGAGYMHLYFTPSSPPIFVKLGEDDGYRRTKDVIRLCCSHIKRICAYNNRLEIGASIIMVAEDLQCQRDVAFGKKKESVPDIDKLKKSLFTSWACPVKQVSLLFMREMGEVNFSQILIENVLRCEISRRMYNLIN